MQPDFNKWVLTSSKIHPIINIKIQKIFFGLLQYIHKMQWQGACHATSSILYILLREQKTDAELYVGEAGLPSVVFDHSWVEIDNQVYDAAISRTLVQGLSFPPVMANIDLSTGEKTKISYGINSGQGYDAFAQQIKQMSFDMYMNNFPGHPNGLWGLSKDIGKIVGVKINQGSIKMKYSDTIWKEKA